MNQIQFVYFSIITNWEKKFFSQKCWDKFLRENIYGNKIYETS